MSREALVQAIYDHALVEALAGFEAFGFNKLGAQLAAALATGDDERVDALRREAKRLTQLG